MRILCFDSTAWKFHAKKLTPRALGYARSGQNDPIMADIRDHFTLAKSRKIVTAAAVAAPPTQAAADLRASMLYDERPGARRLDALNVSSNVPFPIIFKLVIEREKMAMHGV